MTTASFSKLLQDEELNNVKWHFLTSLKTDIESMKRNLLQQFLVIPKYFHPDYHIIPNNAVNAIILALS